MAKEKLISYVKKYKYVALVVLVGVVLMLLPSGKGEQQDTVEPVNVSEGYSLAENRSDRLRDTEARQERDVVTLNRGSGYEDVVVTEQTYPVYQGAVIVCQGAGDSGVHLAVVQAVSVLTGLGSDKITVVQWK